MPRSMVLVYSKTPFSWESLALMIPLFEFLMNSRIVSRSSLWGKPASTFVQPSEMLYPE